MHKTTILFSSRSNNYFGLSIISVAWDTRCGIGNVHEHFCLLVLNTERGLIPK